MNSKCIVAYTPPGSYPPYLNISIIDENTVRITVRGNPNEYTSGTHAFIDIPRDIAIETFYEFEDKIRRD